jgi:hypothetical protein
MSSVADPTFHFDADSVTDPTFHFGAAPDPDPACPFDADPDPDPTFSFDPDPDPYPSFQIKAQNLDKVLKEAHFPYILAYHLQVDAHKVLIRIQLITLIRVRIWIWIHNIGHESLWQPGFESPFGALSPPPPHPLENGMPSVSLPTYVSL